MSGREETSEPVVAQGGQGAASPPSPASPAPPSFGNAGPPPSQPESPGPLDQSGGPVEPQDLDDVGARAVSPEENAAPEAPQPPVTEPKEHLDGPESPWWATAPVEDDAGPSDGIHVLAQPTAGPGEAFGGPSANVATAAGMTTPPEAAPVFDMTAPEHGTPAAWDAAPAAGDGRTGGFSTRTPGAAAEPPLIPDAILPPGTPPGRPGAVSAAATTMPTEMPGTEATTVPSAMPTSAPTSAPASVPTPMPATVPTPMPGATTAMPTVPPTPTMPSASASASASPPGATGQGGLAPSPGTVIAPLYHAEGGLPPAGGPPPPRSPGGPGPRRLLMIGGGVAGAAVIASLVVVGANAMTGSPEPAGPSARSTTSAQASPQPTRPTARPGTGALAPSIDGEKTDRRPLSLGEVFPTAKIMVGGRPYKQDKTSVNHQCGLAARGAMAAALDRGRCRSVVRATYVDGKKYAITTGIAVMPTRAAAVAVSKAGDPSRYEWFRGMPGKVATKIDQAGGYASSTVRGRYIVYSYAQYADGTRPQPADPALRSLTRQFIAYAVRPIDRRAR